MSDTTLSQLFYIERQPVSREWLERLLRRLWGHGLLFRALTPETASWEGQLHSHQPVREAQESRPLPSLEEQIEQIVSKGTGWLTGWDGKISLTLELDTNLLAQAQEAAGRGEPPGFLQDRRFGLVKVEMPGSYLSKGTLTSLSPDQPGGMALIPSYHQVWLAFAHWFEVLCQELRPAFALGYLRPNDQQKEGWFELETAFDPFLRQGRWPTVSGQLKRVRALYAPARHATPALLEEWLSDPAHQVKRLATGDLLLARQERYEDRELDWHLAWGDKQTWENHFAEARMHLQRAQSLSEALEDKSGLWLVQRHLQRLEAREQAAKEGRLDKEDE